MIRPLAVWSATALLSVFVVACAGGKSSPSPSAQAAATAAPTAAPTAATTAATRCPASSGLKGNISEHGVASATSAAIALDAGDFYFQPTCLTSVPRGNVTVTIKNTGVALHNISVPGANIDMDVAPGQTITVQLSLDATAVPFYCKYHRTSGMVGSLIPQ